MADQTGRRAHDHRALTGFDSVAATIGVISSGNTCPMAADHSLFLLLAAGLVIAAGWWLSNAFSAPNLWPFVLWIAPAGVLLGLAAGRETVLPL